MVSARASIVIPVHDRVHTTLRCLQAIVAGTPTEAYSVVLVDNASTDATPQLLAQLDGDVTVITNVEDRGVAQAWAQGLAARDSEIVVLMTQDAEPRPGWLNEVEDGLADRAGAPAVTFPPGRAAAPFPGWMALRRTALRPEVTAAMAAAATPEAAAVAVRAALGTNRDRSRTPAEDGRALPGTGLTNRGVVVFGMHRSGTSAVTKMLIDLGLDPGSPSTLLGATAANPLGHFEPRVQALAHEALLNQLGRYWHCPPTALEAYLQPRFAGAREELAHMANAQFPARGWVFKEPRLCVLWQLYAPMFSQPPAAVLIVRDPVEVATSLQTRDRMSPGHGLALWELYNLAALRQLRGARHVTVVSYSELLARPRQTANRLRCLLEAAGIAERLSGQVDAGTSVRPDLNRSGRGASQVIRSTAPQQALYAHLLQAEASGRIPEERPLPSALAERMAERAALVTAHIEALKGGCEPAPPARPLDRAAVA